MLDPVPSGEYQKELKREAARDSPDAWRELCRQRLWHVIVPERKTSLFPVVVPWQGRSSNDFVGPGLSLFHVVMLGKLNTRELVSISLSFSSVCPWTGTMD